MNHLDDAVVSCLRVQQNVVRFKWRLQMGHGCNNRGPHHNASTCHDWVWDGSVCKSWGSFEPSERIRQGV